MKYPKNKNRKRTHLAWSIIGISVWVTFVYFFVDRFFKDLVIQ